MSRALPQATGLRLQQGLMQAKGLDLQFTPSLAIIGARVDKLGLDIRSFREPLKRSLRIVVIPSIKRNFDSGGRPPWAPLAASTVRKKGSTRKLIDSGALARNMGYMSIWKITKNYAVIEDLPERIWYGKVHQGGQGAATKTLKVIGSGSASNASSVSFSEGGIPARPFVLLQKSDERAIESVFRHWLDERVRANLGRL